MNKNKCSITLRFNSAYKANILNLHWIFLLYRIIMAFGSCDFLTCISNLTYNLTFTRQCAFLWMSPVRPIELSMAIFFSFWKITRIYSAWPRSLSQCWLACRPPLQLHGSLPFALIKTLPSEIHILFILYPWAFKRKRLWN